MYMRDSFPSCLNWTGSLIFLLNPPCDGSYAKHADAAVLTQRLKSQYPWQHQSELMI